MARKEYTAGKIKIESDDMSDVTSMSITMNGQDWDITAIGDANPSVEEVTETFEISFTANYNPTDSAQAACRNKFIGGSRSLTSLAYYEDASAYLSGSALLTSVALSKSVGGFDQLTVSATSRGTWSYTSS